MLADKLKATGVSGERKDYDGVTRELFGIGRACTTGQRLKVMPRCAKKSLENSE